MASNPTSLLDFLLKEMPDDPAERRRAGLGLAPLVCVASDPAVRRNLIEELARRLNLRPREVEGSEAAGPPAGRSRDGLDEHTRGGASAG